MYGTSARRPDARSCAKRSATRSDEVVADTNAVPIGLIRLDDGPLERAVLPAIREIHQISGEKHVALVVAHDADDRSRQDATQLAAAALRDTFRRVLALRRNVRSSEPATIHHLRVCFKRFRYVSELLRPLLKEGGRLILGHSEGVHGMVSGLRHAGSTIYHKESDHAGDHPDR